MLMMSALRRFDGMVFQQNAARPRVFRQDKIDRFQHFHRAESDVF